MFKTQTSSAYDYDIDHWAKKYSDNWGNMFCIWVELLLDSIFWL